jgi:hypothetical protein
MQLSLAHVYWVWSSWLVSEDTDSKQIQGTQPATESTTEAELQGLIYFLYLIIHEENKLNISIQVTIYNPEH